MSVPIDGTHISVAMIKSKAVPLSLHGMNNSTRN